MKWNDQINQSITSHENLKYEANNKIQLLDSLRSRLGDWFQVVEKTSLIVESLNQQNCLETSQLMLDTLRLTIKEIEELINQKG